MGSVSRFLSALGGLFLLLFAIPLFVVPAIQTLAHPEHADFPGGAGGIAFTLLAMASIPLTGAVILFRRAVRRSAGSDSTVETTAAPSPVPVPSRSAFEQAEIARASESREEACGAGPAPAALETLAEEPVGARIEAAPTPVPQPAFEPDPALASRPHDHRVDTVTPAVTNASPAVTPKRTWLPTIGLAVALIGVIFAIIGLGYLASAEGDPLGAALVIGLAAIALWLGLRMARAGDPDLARGFLKDLGASASTLGARTTLTNLLGTSLGRGVLTVLIGIPMMIAWKDLAPLTGPYAMAIFSLVDPLPIAVRPHWWLNAVVSGTVWFVLYVVFAATVQIISGQPDASIGFILPFMAYPFAMAISGVIRFAQWVSR